MKKLILLIIFTVSYFLNSCADKNVSRLDNSAKIIDDKNNTIDNNKLHSVDYEERYPNGQLKVKGQFKKNKRDSLWVSYYPNGTKQSENYYFNDLLQGNTASYYKSGKIRFRGFYLEGKKHGKWILWDLKGNKNIIVYKNGIKQ